MPAKAAPESAIDAIERTQSELRARSRVALGVTGDEDTVSLREGIARSGTSWYPLVALGLLFVVDEFQRYAFFVLGPEVSRTLGISRSMLALVLIVQLVAITLAVFPLAALVQRKPRRALVAITTAFVWSVMTALTAFVANVWGLLLTLTMQGAATGSVRATHGPLLADTYPPRRASAPSPSTTCSTLSATSARPSSSPSSPRWRDSPGAARSLCSGWCVSPPVRARSSCAIPGSGAGTSSGCGRRCAATPPAPSRIAMTELGFFEILRRLLLIASVRRIVLMWAMWGAFIIPFQTFFFFFLDERWNMGPGARGVFIGVAAVATIPALAIFGRRGEALFRSDPARLVNLAMVVVISSIVCLTVGALSPLFGLMAVAFCLATAGIAVMPSFLGVLLMSIVQPRMRAHASALGGIAFSAVGGVGGLLLLSGVDRRYGLGGAMVALALPGAITVLLLRSVRSSVVPDLDRLIDEVIEERSHRGDDGQG